MSYSVDIEADNLVCRSERAARQAAAIMNADIWMRRHLSVSVSGLAVSAPPHAWRLVIEEFDGCSWNEENSDRVWMAVREQMAEGATIEFRHEEGHRYRIHWVGDRVVAERTLTTIWAKGVELRLR